MNTKKWFALMAVCGFASVISFFQINSYWADMNNFNGFFGWLGIGIVFGLAAIFCYTKVSKAGSDNDSGY
jgi:amino acid transporter